MIYVPWNAVPHEGKHKILYNNDENIVLHNEYDRGQSKEHKDLEILHDLKV